MADNEIKIILSGDASQLEASTAKASKALANVQKASSSANYALTNLSRVASDAPFGFIAIQNNLEPLIGSFGQLSKEAGGTGGALKSLASGLMGPAGVMVGFTIVSAAVTTAIQKYGSLSAALDALFTSTDAVVQVNKQLIEVEADASAQIQGQLAGINALLSVAKDNTASTEARQLAIKKLNQEYPQYLGNLSLENVNTQKTTDSVNKLTESLIRKAKIEGIQKIITKLSEEQAKTYLELRQNISDLDSPFQRIINTFTRAATGVSASVIGLNQLTNGAGKTQEQIDLLQSSLNKLTREQADNNEIVIKSEKVSKANTESIKKQKDAVKTFYDFYKTIKVQGSVGRTNQPSPITALALPTNEQTKAAGEAIRKYYDNIQAVSEASAQNVVSGVTDTLSSIGAAFASGGGVSEALKAAGEGILKIIGGVLQQLGEQIIFTAELIATLKTALKSMFTNTPALLAVGVGLIVLGGLLKNIKLTGTKAFADGGIVSGPTRALIGEAGPEAVIPLSKLDKYIGGNNNVFVTGVLSGENIYLQQQRTSDRRARFV